MSGFDRERLRALLQERRITPRALSNEIGDNPYIVRDILNAKSKNPRSDTLSKIADALGVPLSEFVDETAPALLPPNELKIVPRYLEVRYRAKAGQWYEMDGDEPPPYFDGAVAPKPKYAAWPQWLEYVDGDSVNLKIQPGQFAHVVDAREMGYAPKTGDWVVVERHRDQGAIRERTIKQVEVRDGGAVLLWPRSTNPKWQEPVKMRDGAREGEDVEAFIVGLVVGSYDGDF